MATSKPSKRPNSSAPGVKLLITAASLVATLGGWAVLSAKEPELAAAPTPARAAAPAVMIKLAPLPTLVPALTPQARSQLVTIDQPRPAARAPQPAAANEIVLRDVSAPALPSRSAPAPVANTGSSR